MRGWMILFALMTVAAAGMTLNPSTVASAKGIGVLFGTLFLLSLLALAIRGRAE